MGLAAPSTFLSIEADGFTGLESPKSSGPEETVSRKRHEGLCQTKFPGWTSQMDGIVQRDSLAVFVTVLPGLYERASQDVLGVKYP